MAIDRCAPLKIESPGTGGTQNDMYPTVLNPQQDGCDARAYFLQSSVSADGTTYIDRNGADLRLVDANAGAKTASELVSKTLGAVSAHQSLSDLAHFVGAPADGWASGSVRRDVYSGPLLSSSTWYTSSSQSKKIYAEVFTYVGPLASSCACFLYAADGSTITRQMTENYSYTGPMLTTTTRTWT